MKSRQTSSFTDLMFAIMQTTLTLYHYAQKEILPIKNKKLIIYRET
ncbi:hypothetical protein UUU_35110 [Klebsiella pneumoniae subsp. pneumoniae DSM 30104 = JCM 1662 = NBRC 14940]|nr:hypothetical protein UUU_35110 [Klebsiella pneumoniae subsp. pneumoniae DSM 30104 = JCM 1662 = NBRC 14940]